MKKILIPVLGLILGGGAGALLHFSSTNTSEIFVHYRTGEYIDPFAKATGVVKGTPQMFLADGASHDFGEIESNRVYEHEFIMQNQGVKPLKIRFKNSSTISATTDLSAETMTEIEPKGSVPIKVKLIARKVASPFEESIVIETNDPGTPFCSLALKGKVKAVTETIPAGEDFGDLNFGESKKFVFKAVSYEHDNLKITGYEWFDKKRESYFDVSYEKLSAAELAKVDGKPKSGYDVTVKLKPGHSLGWVAQDLFLKTNLPSHDRMAYTIRGRIVGNLAVRCEEGAFDEKRNLVELGVLRRGEPRTIDLTLTIKGDAKEFKGKLIKDLSTPTGLYDVTFGSAIVRNDELSVVPLSIVVKTPVGRINRIGPSIKDYGHVVFETNLKDAPRVTILISFEQVGNW